MASAVAKTMQEVLQNVEDDTHDALRVNVVAESFDITGAHSSGLAISSAVNLSALAPADAVGIFLQTLTQHVRFTLDGTTPTVSLGFRLAVGESPVYISLSATVILKVIQEAATASLQYQWVR